MHVAIGFSRNFARSMSVVALVTACLLLIPLIPLIAMQFTREMAWDLADFALAGMLVFGAGATYVGLAHTPKLSRYRATIGCTLGVAVFLLWLELAVGIVGP